MGGAGEAIPRPRVWPGSGRTAVPKGSAGVRCASSDKWRSSRQPQSVGVTARRSASTCQTRASTQLSTTIACSVAAQVWLGTPSTPARPLRG